MAKGPNITLYQYGGIARDKTMSHPCGKVHMALSFKGLEYKRRNLRSPRAPRRLPRGTVLLR